MSTNPKDYIIEEDYKHYLEPAWYDLACSYSSLIPFVGGIVSDHLVSTISAESYYHGYNRGIAKPTLFLAGGFLALDCLIVGAGIYGIFSERAPYATPHFTESSLDVVLFMRGLLFANMGYFYNFYRVGVNYTEEMNNIALKDHKRSVYLSEMRSEGLTDDTVFTKENVKMIDQMIYEDAIRSDAADALAGEINLSGLTGNLSELY